ncbi:MAG TPA: CotH kinase family protein [Chloroflexaceae bacterium]|nr:CotH kinase family protein [Chloroflexaceae bacterium]
MRVTTARRTAVATIAVVAASVVVSGLAACAATPRPAAPASAATPAASPAAESGRPAGWRAESHGDKAEPNYAVVFPPDAVKTFTITITPESWQKMQDDLNTNLKTRLGSGQSLADYTPIWVPATISYDGETWTTVGVRYKGNSSIVMAWTAGRQNLPFKVDFDKFEDDYPEIKNQRFFGFNELSLANNTSDPTAMRDTIVYGMLGQAGLPAMRTAAYEVLLDRGDGPKSLGLYTATEVVDDTGVAHFFGGKKGNIYEANGPGASFAEGTADQIPTGFEKKNNDDSGYADLERLYTVLHDPRRTTDPEGWRNELEAVFNVDGFLEWLGIATVVANWDTYGTAPHNFFLYADPATNKLNWVPWDHNDTFQANFTELMPFDRANVDGSMPLIRFLLDDPVYSARYVELLKDNSRTALEPNALITRVRQRAALLAPYAARQMEPKAYDKAVNDLVDFIESRGARLQEFLDQR